MGDSPRTLIDIVPDLIVGLIGIPVAFALQEVITQALYASMVERFWNGVAYFVLILAMYAFYSIALYMDVESGRASNYSEHEWQKHLVQRLIISAPFTVTMVGFLVTAGVLFNPGEMPETAWINLREGYHVRAADMIMLSFIVLFVYTGILTVLSGRRIRQSYPYAYGYFLWAFLLGFTIAFVVFVKSENGFPIFPIRP